MGRARPLSGVLLVAPLVGVVIGCGLPDPRPLLPPPTAPSAVDRSDQFSFAQPTDTAARRVQSVATFGYEIYYRFSGIGAATDRNLQDVDQLDASGFVSLRKTDDRLGVTRRPLIAVPGTARAEHHVILSFQAMGAGGDPDATLSTGDRVSLRRGVANTTTGVYERFECEGFQDQDADVSEAYRDEFHGDCAESEVVQLQLYAVAYARDADGRTQFSDALYLGSIDVTFRS